MMNRALARRRMLQHARRALFAFAAGSLLLTASPASAVDLNFEARNPSPNLETSALAEESAHLSLGPLAGLRLGGILPEPVNADALPAGQIVAVPNYGQTIVDIAMAYLGYPYVAAGAGPYGFDCSGFTQFVVANATGIWISHAVEAQPFSAGYFIDYGAWQPGDLIFFQNTYRAGVSHAAIYLGDGMIIHAENEGSGVTIDSIYSDYYGPRYWGAVRVAG